MARLFADENFPLPAVDALRRLGHNVLTIHEAGKAQQSTPDDIVLKMASADGRAILTLPDFPTWEKTVACCGEVSIRSGQAKPGS